MATRENFSDWPGQFAHLDALAIALPQSQRPLASIHKFAQASVEDGVAALFYNHADLVGSQNMSFCRYTC